MSADIKPRFQVEKLQGKAMRQFKKQLTDKKGNLIGGFEEYEEEVDAGWMVYFPSGSSIRVWTEDEMVRQGFLDDPDLVNMETGDVVGKAGTVDLKKLSEQKERVTKSTKVHHVT